MKPTRANKAELSNARLQAALGNSTPRSCQARTGLSHRLFRREPSSIVNRKQMWRPGGFFFGAASHNFLFGFSGGQSLTSDLRMTAIKIANAPCSWGVLEFDLPGEALGYAQVLDEIRDTGYSGTELGDWGFMPTDPTALRRELSARELAMLGAFVQVAFADQRAHAAGAEAAVRTAKLLAAVEGKSPLIVLADDNATQPVR